MVCLVSTLRHIFDIRINTYRISAKVRSSYCPLAYFSDIFISGKNVVISAERWQHFCQKWKYRKNMQGNHNLNGLYFIGLNLTNHLNLPQHTSLNHPKFLSFVNRGSSSMKLAEAMTSEVRKFRRISQITGFGRRSADLDLVYIINKKGWRSVHHIVQTW